MWAMPEVGERAPTPATDAVCAVLVSYHPDVATLRAAVDAVRPQVGTLVVVDNGSTGLDSALDGSETVVLRQDGNVGLAAAQNVGIDWAREHGCTARPDSRPGQRRRRPAWSTRCWLRWHRAVRDRPASAPSARVFHDPREDRDAPFVRVAFPMSHKLWCDAGTPAVRVRLPDQLRRAHPDRGARRRSAAWTTACSSTTSTSSGASGPASRGYALFGVCGATMEHRLGDDRQRRPRRPPAGRPARAGAAVLHHAQPDRALLGRRTRRGSGSPRTCRGCSAKFLIFSVLVGPRRVMCDSCCAAWSTASRGRAGGCPVNGDLRDDGRRRRRGRHLLAGRVAGALPRLARHRRDDAAARRRAGRQRLDRRLGERRPRRGPVCGSCETGGNLGYGRAANPGVRQTIGGVRGGRQPRHRLGARRAGRAARGRRSAGRTAARSAR